MSRCYYRPLVQLSPFLSPNTVPLAGGECGFEWVEVLARDAKPRIIRACDVPDKTLARLSQKRPAVLGLDTTRPNLMGIVNVTPDSFSDGGMHHSFERAAQFAANLPAQGADILDIGGESTRPGALCVEESEEIARTKPVIEAIRAAGITTPISIDTRKAATARAAFAAGADMLNDVSALSFDPTLASFAAQKNAPICLVHAQGTPETMQDNPLYDNVLLDVYDYLEQAVEMAEKGGIAREKIIVDPGIGFGKTVKHNVQLLRGMSLFHGLGCLVLLGASRKNFIGTLSSVKSPEARVHGSVGVALAAAGQGVQIIRVHDVAATNQALTLWRAALG